MSIKSYTLRDLLLEVEQKCLLKDEGEVAFVYFQIGRALEKQSIISLFEAIQLSTRIKEPIDGSLDVNKSSERIIN